MLRLCYGLSPTAAGRAFVQIPAAEHRLAASSDPRAANAHAIRRLQDVHVTAAACEALNELLTHRSGTEKCLRLSTVQGNYRFVLDDAIDQDISFRHQERIVLVVSETVSRDLWGITVDCSDDAGRNKLVF